MPLSDLNKQLADSRDFMFKLWSMKQQIESTKRQEKQEIETKEQRTIAAEMTKLITEHTEGYNKNVKKEDFSADISKDTESIKKKLYDKFGEEKVNSLIGDRLYLIPQLVESGLTNAKNKYSQELVNKSYEELNNITSNTIKKEIDKTREVIQDALKNIRNKQSEFGENTKDIINKLQKIGADPGHIQKVIELSQKNINIGGLEALVSNLSDKNLEAFSKNSDSEDFTLEQFASFVDTKSKSQSFYAKNGQVYDQNNKLVNPEDVWNFNSYTGALGNAAAQAESTKRYLQEIEYRENNNRMNVENGVFNREVAQEINTIFGNRLYEELPKDFQDTMSELTSTDYLTADKLYKLINIPDKINPDNVQLYVNIANDIANDIHISSKNMDNYKILLESVKDNLQKIRKNVLSEMKTYGIDPIKPNSLSQLFDKRRNKGTE